MNVDLGISTDGRRTAVLSATLLIATMLAWSQWRVQASLNDAYGVALSQLAQMEADAERILSLRREPQTAAARARSSQELSAVVEKALSAAAVDRNSWRDSVPEPASRVGDGPYKRVSTRLFVEAVTVRQVAAFLHQLRTLDPALDFTSLGLNNRRLESPAFDAEIAVSYLLYSPK